MKKYLVLYQWEGATDGPSVSEIFADTAPEKKEAGMAAWREWYEKCGRAVVDPGTPLDKSMTVTAGASTPGRSSITGYTLLDAESMEQVVALIQGHPHFQMSGTSVQILESVSIPGM